VTGAAATYEFTADRDRIDPREVHGFLTASYWARGIGFETVERSMAGSMCFGYLLDGQTVAFARVISDGATFAYLADVFVVPAHRARGLGKRLLEGIFADPRLSGLRRWLLRTLDAHDLYRRFGFDEVAAPDTWMERVATVTGGSQS
jgi:N-acetylglutamate synthase-like GNAT family acetyltransferase